MRDELEIIDYWFSDSVAKLWFNSTPEFDDALRVKYESFYLNAKAGKLSDWNASPEGALALVIIFDQLPLNIYRGKPESFAAEKLARETAREAIKRGYETRYSKIQKAFLYMPFMHSESIDDQDYSVQLFETAGLTENLHFAKHHREIIRKFGRFPHRNAILGRESTAAEIDYLNSSGAFRG